MTVVIHLDNRETKLAEILREKVVISQPEIGDVILKKEGQILLVLERKTISDLQSSLTDGRYREQKNRLLSSSYRVGYLFEGYVPVKFRSTFDSIVFGTQHRDGMEVYQSRDLQHSADLILRMKKKLEQYIKEGNYDNRTGGEKGQDAEGGGGEYLPKLSKCPREHVTPQLCYKMSLAQVPNVSLNIAERIAEVYPDMSTLSCAKEEELKKINLGKKKLGPVLAKRILYMFNFTE